MRFSALATALLLIAISACSTARKHTHPAPVLPGMEHPDSSSPVKTPAKHTPGSRPSEGDEDLGPIPDEIIREQTPSAQNETEATEAIAENDELDEGETIPARKHQIPFEFNQRVAAWIEYFSQKDRERFQRFLDRGEPYREAVENILEENNVPTDLYYLGLIESGFNFRAKSKAKAVGVWQFMRATGKLYGLTVDPYLDERKDPIRATEAAARLMRDLYQEFHSWYLAMAAYNAGLGRIRKAVKRGKSHDFWELVQKKVLPKETMDYVPKFLAARYIGENPDMFAFYLNEEQKYPNVELVRVPSPISFGTIEQSCRIPAGTLAFVNPHYLQSYTHPGKTEDEIWVPSQYQKSVENSYSKLFSQRIHVRPVKTASHPQREKVLTYRVKNGDSLKIISRKTGLSVAYLKRVNGLRTSQIHAGELLKLTASSYHQKKSHPRRRRRKRNR